MILCTAALWLVLQLFMAFFLKEDTRQYLPVNLLFSCIFVFQIYPLSKNPNNKYSWIPDILFFLMAVSTIVFWLLDPDFFDSNILKDKPVSVTHIIMCIILFISLAEAVRRSAGIDFFVILLCFFAYMILGRFLPGIIHHFGVTADGLIKDITFGERGIFGTAFKVCTETIFFFPILGVLLNFCKADRVLYIIGMKLTGKRHGGTAKAAVISSGLMGMFTGSSVTNVSGTGTYTIPHMIESGLTPEEAGSVEAAASSGGELAPPVMGVTAFVMASLIEIPYLRVATASLIPALAMFAGIYLLVHLILKKRNIKVISAQEEGSILKPVDILHLLPFILLPVLAGTGMKISVSLIICISVAIVVRLASGDDKPSAVELRSVFIKGIKQSAYLMVVTGACGVMTGILHMTGLDRVIHDIIFQTGMHSFLLSLFIIVIAILVFGMPLPTIASFLLAWSLFYHPLRELLNFRQQVWDLNTSLMAGMFIFCFSIVAQITPPLCQASVCAAKIAKADEKQTSSNACFLVLNAFIIPFIFIYQPAILIEGGIGRIIISTFILIAGMFCFSYILSVLYLSIGKNRHLKGEGGENK